MPTCKRRAGNINRNIMKVTQLLHDQGQSLWLDNITRDLLNSGTLKRYIDEHSVTGLTSNPTIFDHAIKSSAAYDAAIRQDLAKGKSGEGLFFELALDDLTRAADLVRPVYNTARFEPAVGMSVGSENSELRAFRIEVEKNRSMGEHGSGWIDKELSRIEAGSGDWGAGSFRRRPGD